MRLAVQVLLLLLPWSLRRRLLCLLLGYDIHPTARIGLSIVAPGHLRMCADATIGHLNLIRGLNLLNMELGAGISHLNWITGVPEDAPYFPKQPDRRSQCIIEEGGGITRRHYIDCTNAVRIERYAMIAGMGTQILTHSVDMETNQQGSEPVTVGEYSMVGTRSVILGGATLPAFSALGAASMLRSSFTDTYSIYSGVPAQRVASISPDAKYFSHTVPGQPGARFRRA